jgi:UDP-N-acetylmuramate: L-alanyl-gamma-D-glutamyl-meso-diaminopimelate ligase
VVTGTHGKTTTTALIAWIFRQAGQDPSFLIGGIAKDLGQGAYFSESDYFILEGDEYDTAFFDKGPKFLHYFPDAVILTSVEFDHADIYKDLEAVETSFKRLVNLVPRRGRIIAFDSGESIDRAVERAFCPLERYGRSNQAAWRIEDLRLESARTSWSLVRGGRPWAQFSFPLAGEYNVWNATAAAAMAASYGISAAQIASALESFKSVKRRLEVTSEVGGITIIDDFAHHPTAIAATLRALRSRYPGSRLWAILEPRSNTLRRNVFQKELAASLAVADEIILARVFKEDAIRAAERLDIEAVGAGVAGLGRRARVLADADSIVETAAPEMRAGDVVAILSNGAFGGIYHKLPQRLRSWLSRESLETGGVKR